VIIPTDKETGGNAPITGSFPPSASQLKWMLNALKKDVAR